MNTSYWVKNWVSMFQKLVIIYCIHNMVHKTIFTDLSDFKTCKYLYLISICFQMELFVVDI